MPTEYTPDSVIELREKWRKRIHAARETQKKFHSTWAMNLAFAAGKHWQVWDEKSRSLRAIVDIDPSYADRDLYTADRITEYRQAQLGELKSEDDRPQLLAAQEGPDAEQIASMLNRLSAYGWEHEWDADTAIEKARRFCYDLGHCAVRCLWNPNEGEVTGQVPIDRQGQPIQDQEELAYLEQNGALPDGSLPKYKQTREGRSNWRVYSPFQTLPPPGVVHEDDFPWEALMVPVPVEEIKAIFGIDVREDTDIANGIGVPVAMQSKTGDAVDNRLRDHAWFYPCFERPTTKNPQGTTLFFAGSNYDLLDAQEGLPYTLDGKPHSGIVYFHWYRLSDRFQSRAAIENLRDPQRIINRRKTQNVELIDRAMPKILTRKGDWPDTTGAPNEIVELSANAQPPQVFQGAPPGQWMYQDIASLDDDLTHASTLSLIRLGENPSNVETYGQLALLNDNEHGKRATIVDEARDRIAILVKLSLSDVKKYWPEEKEANVLGEEGRLERVVFEKSKIPPDLVVKPAKGQTQPRTQGAQIKKIDAILAAMVESGYAALNPPATVSWYVRSIEAGSPQELPQASPSTQQQLAHLENLMMRNGEDVVPAYYDVLPEHLPIHRQEEDEARAAGDVELAARIEKHLLVSLAMQQQANQMLGAVAGVPQAPPGPPDQNGGGGNTPIPAFAGRDLRTLQAGR